MRTLLAETGAMPLLAVQLSTDAGVDVAAALLNISISAQEQMVSVPGLLDATIALRTGATVHNLLCDEAHRVGIGARWPLFSRPLNSAAESSVPHGRVSATEAAQRAGRSTMRPACCARRWVARRPVRWRAAIANGTGGGVPQPGLGRRMRGGSRRGARGGAAVARAGRGGCMAAAKASDRAAMAAKWEIGRAHV